MEVNTGVFANSENKGDTYQTAMHADKENDGTEKFSYHEGITKIDELGRFLKNTQQRLNVASMRSHLLNVDVVTQFDPHQVDLLRKTVKDCQDCIQRIKEKENDIHIPQQQQQRETSAN